MSHSISNLKTIVSCKEKKKIERLIFFNVKKTGYLERAQRFRWNFSASVATTDPRLILQGQYRPREIAYESLRRSDVIYAMK